MLQAPTIGRVRPSGKRVTRFAPNSARQCPKARRKDRTITNSAGPASQIIEAGELIEVTIRDNEDGSLLGAPRQRVIALPKLAVTPAGTVLLPCADEVYVTKMTPDEAIQDKLLAIVPSAQVLLLHQTGRKSAVDLVSGVAQPGTYPLPDRNFTILSLLAQGGGVNEGLNNPQIRSPMRAQSSDLSPARWAWPAAPPSFNPRPPAGPAVRAAPAARRARVRPPKR